MPSIRRRSNCLVITATYGMSPKELAGALTQAPAGAVMDLMLACRMRVFAVIGLPSDLLTLNHELTESGELLAIYANDPRLFGAKDHVIHWFANGVRTRSSDALFTALSGLNFYDTQRVMPAPNNPKELESCVRLLEACPELQNRLWKMRSVSEEWRDLIFRIEDRLDDLINALDSNAWARLAEEILSPLKVCA